MTMITPSYLGETIEYSSLHACRSTLEDPTGTTWTTFSTVSATSALLLAADDEIRFVPKTNIVGTFTLTALAWDRSVRTAGSVVNPAKLSNTAFSTTSLTATEMVSGPTWSAAARAAFPSLLPNLMPAGVTIASVFEGVFHDPNSNVSVGVAIVALSGLSSGTWQYSTNNAANWTKFPAVSMASALLLAGADLVRFVANNNFVGSPTLTAYAWDGSNGVAGTGVNLTKLGIGGVTGFSPTTLVAAAPVNRAPSLSPTVVPAPPVAVNTTGPAITIASLLTSSGYTDPDGTKLRQGIAVESVSTSVGSLQYRLAGGTWMPLGSASPGVALLLPSTASLRLVANRQVGAAKLTFAGWDQTQGLAGQTFDITASGGPSAFSSTTGTLSITVRQAPSWSAASGAHLPALLPNATPVGISVASVFGSYFQDINPIAPNIAVTALMGSGTWQFSIDAGITWNTFAAPSLKNALLLTDHDLIRFVPKNNTVGVAALTAYAWDGSTGIHGTSVSLTQLGTGGASAYSAATLTATCTVNTAPTLTTTSFVLAATNENAASPAVTVATLLQKAAYADGDGKSVPSGIAITADSGFGVWQWLNHLTWTAIPSVSPGAAFLSPSSAQVRFLPTDTLAANTTNSASLTFLGWDQMIGTADSLFNVAVQGGPSAFSPTAATAAMTINFVKQAPAWASAASAAFTPVLGFSTSNAVPNPSGDSVASVFGSAFVDASGTPVGIAITALGGMSDGAWQYSTNGSTTWSNLPAVSMTDALLLAASTKLRFVPNKAFSGIVTLTAYAWDGTGNFTGAANLTKAGLGGTKPFSAIPLTATCVINTAPTLLT